MFCQGLFLLKQNFTKSTTRSLVFISRRLNGLEHDTFKYLGKKGMEVGDKKFHYEIKVKGKYGAWRVLGNMNDKGQLIFDLFEKSH